ncbi:50S ribosomal protein L25 [Hathewaya histolytica]|uniref:Large ribosomal subunit protein bL25 n=1 Tax=Hathewaya histolytica TaxID=1498 RepID=A0A4U9RL01_HATHI|nr:50S ribosomal protein L25 [Hathewaya histolytica]VTQ92812.1 50S ribosomal protein L25/general stress protein Ctc [Hathewaya histolytica]
MENLIINKREKRCSKYAKKERKNGRIPGVLYGKEFNNYMFEVGELELNNSIRKHGEHSIIDVIVEGENKKVLIKEVQREPLNNRILHVDFENISLDQKIITEVPLQFIGEGRVSSKGGILQKEKDSLKVECKADVVPQSIEVDLSNFDTGDIFRISDLELGEDLTFIEPLNSVIATVTHNSFALDEKEEEEEIATE